VSVRIGFAEFDALAPPCHVSIGWCEFDAIGAPCEVAIGWVEFDCRSPNNAAVPPYRPGGGVTRYHSDSKKQYNVPVDDFEGDEEEIIMSILMEIAQHVLL
jgi:hypothetical protein